MADAKITALTALSSAATTDILPIVENPLGTPETKKITVANLAASIAIDTLGAPTDITTRNASSTAHGLMPKLANTSYSFLNGKGAYDTNLSDGWINPDQTWTYDTASTFTIAGDYTTVYTPGVKLKLTQTSVKYFYVSSSTYSAPDTTVTVTGGSDYTLESAAITANYYSRCDTPKGFPNWFNFVPTWTGFSSDPTVAEAAFTVSGRLCTVHVSCSGAGTSNATGLVIGSLPIAAVLTGRGVATYGYDSGAVLSTACRLFMAAAGASVSVYADMASGGWTNSGGKYVNLDFSYGI